MSYAVISGLLGSSASVLSKLAFKDGFNLEFNTNGALKLVSLLGFILCNLFMMTAFKQALESSKNTATTMALNMASNFIFTVHKFLIRNIYRCQFEGCI